MKKILFSFVLSVILLFSFCLAGTLEYNTTNTFDIPYLQYDVEIAGDNDFFLAYYEDYDNSSYYTLVSYDSSRLDDLSVFGSIYNWDSDGSSIYRLSNLKPSSDAYTLASPYYQQFVFYSNGNITVSSGGGTRYLYSTDFPYLTSDFSYSSGYNLLQTYKSLSVLSSSFDIYQASSSNDLFILGEQIYGNSSVPSIPSFTTSLTQSEINNNILGLFSSNFLVDNLPKNYTNFFIRYNEETDEYFYYFFPNYVCPAGVVYLDDNGLPDYYNFYFYNLNKPLLNLFTTDYVYVFTSSNDLYYLSDKFVAYSYEFSNNKDVFNYSSDPIIYSTPLMPFTVFYDGSLAENPSFSVNSFAVTDSNDNIIVSNDILSQPKTNDSIWNSIQNILNPVTDNYYIDNIENQHSAVLSKADNASFFGLFESSRNLISDILSVSWLITASNMLFNYFSSFLILCCVFLTISRVMR